MTTNFLYTQNKLTTLSGYSKTNPYKDGENNDIVSVSNEYKYINSCPNNIYEISNDLFIEFITKKIFNINNEKIFENSIDGDYIRGIEYEENNNSHISSYYQAPIINDIKSHLAGTIISYRIRNSSKYDNFNCCVLIEESYEENNIINKVNIKLRNEEPLMQTINDCSGNVYSFKKGVKLSDFSKFIEQKNEGVPTGYIDFNSIQPSNLSKNLNNNEINEIENETNYKYILKSNDNGYEFNDLVTIEKIESKIKGYIVFCSFLENPYEIEGENNPNPTLDYLIKCKPYITVIRFVKEKPMKNNFINFPNENEFLIKALDKNRIYIDERTLEIIPHINILPKFSVFYDNISGMSSGPDLNNEGNYYLLKSMILQN